MAGNKYVDLRKIGNFVRNKCCPEDISKDKGKKADFKKSFENFKIADGHVTYKGKKKWYLKMIEKFATPQYHSILP